LTDTLNIRINPDAVLEHHPINDRYSAFVADDFLLNPEAIIEHALAVRDAFESPERGYPGEVLDLLPVTFPEITRFIRSNLSRCFSFARSGIEDSCQVSITTLQPEHFSWIQRLPHTDHKRAAGKDNYALLVYLFDNPALGGTGFFQYRDEAFWKSMAPRQLEDPNGGLELVETRYPMFLGPSTYPCESDEAVELITSIPAKFNRMICYSGDIPHSACIPDASLLTDDLRRGRLTLNSFASVWPKNR
jgi:hypothetical protein